MGDQGQIGSAMRVAVFGLGYVGTVTAACLADQGHDVWAVDPQSTKVSLVRQGKSPIVEPGLGELIEKAVRTGCLHATSDWHEALAGADISLLCVSTPSSRHGSTDISDLLRAVKEIGQALVAANGAAPPFHSIVIRSTVPPGTVDSVIQPALEAEMGRPAGVRFGMAMCPEFLREGSGVEDFLDPPFTVIGTAEPAVATALRRLFGFLDRPVRVVPTRTAEGLKYACNAFHAMKVSFTNELARLYRALEVDGRYVMDIFREDYRLNISPAYLRPGFAFGGSCLPKDLRSLLYLARVNSVETPVLNATLVSNQLVVDEAVQQALAWGGRRVAMLGLSFKAETDDLRESPNVELAERLLGKGFELRIFDPIVQPARLLGANRDYIESKLPHLRRLLAESAATALNDADLAIVSSDAADVLEAVLTDPPPRVLDLNGRLGRDVETLPGYHGVTW